MNQFVALPDTLCIACYVDRLYAARLLAARGRLQDAGNLLGQRLNVIITPIEVLIALERGRVAMKLKRTIEAADAFTLVTSAWSNADPVLQPLVAEARGELQKLGAPTKRR
jgi:hypothetical protein